MDRRALARIARMKGVQAAVTGAAAGIESRAKAEFAAHDRPGGHQIGTARVHRGVDRLVYLSGPAPVALEFGHFTREPKDAGDAWSPTFVPGLHIMGRAARGR